MRVVSLIASSTETIYALGYGDCLVGRSHECDFPDEVLNVPVCTAAKFDLVGSSREIDQRVRATLSTQGSVYRTDTQLLEALEPDLIVTQDQCEICAVVLRDVEEATNRFSYGQPEIVSLAPGDLESVLSGIIEIAKGLGDPERGERLVDGMRARPKVNVRIGADVENEFERRIRLNRPLKGQPFYRSAFRDKFDARAGGVLRVNEVDAWIRSRRSQFGIGDDVDREPFERGFDFDKWSRLSRFERIAQTRRIQNCRSAAQRVDFQESVDSSSGADFASDEIIRGNMDAAEKSGNAG